MGLGFLVSSFLSFLWKVPTASRSRLRPRRSSLGRARSQTMYHHPKALETPDEATGARFLNHASMRLRPAIQRRIKFYENYGVDPRQVTWPDDASPFDDLASIFALIHFPTNEHTTEGTFPNRDGKFVFHNAGMLNQHPNGGLCTCMSGVFLPAWLHLLDEQQLTKAQYPLSAYLRNYCLLDWLGLRLKADSKGVPRVGLQGEWIEPKECAAVERAFVKAYLIDRATLHLKRKRHPMLAISFHREIGPKWIALIREINDEAGRVLIKCMVTAAGLVSLVHASTANPSVPQKICSPLARQELGRAFQVLHSCDLLKFSRRAVNDCTRMVGLFHKMAKESSEFADQIQLLREQNLGLARKRKAQMRVNAGQGFSSDGEPDYMLSVEFVLDERATSKQNLDVANKRNAQMYVNAEQGFSSLGEPDYIKSIELVLDNSTKQDHSARNLIHDTVDFDTAPCYKWGTGRFGEEKYWYNDGNSYKPVPHGKLTVAKAKAYLLLAPGKRRVGRAAVKPPKQRWTKEEHELFEIGVKTHGRKWKKIAESIPNKTGNQVKSHMQAIEKKAAKAKAGK